MNERKEKAKERNRKEKKKDTAKEENLFSVWECRMIHNKLETHLWQDDQ